MDGRREIEAAKLRIVAAKRQVATGEQLMETATKFMSAAKSELQEAEQFLKETEKMLEVMDVDVTDSPVKRNGNRGKKRKVPMSPESVGGMNQHVVSEGTSDGASPFRAAAVATSTPRRQSNEFNTNSNHESAITSNTRNRIPRQNYYGDIAATLSPTATNQANARNGVNATAGQTSNSQVQAERNVLNV